MDFRALPPLTVKESFKSSVLKTFKCSGRSRRSEFWNFCMIIILDFIIYVISLFTIPFENDIKNNDFISVIMDILITLRFLFIVFQIFVFISLISAIIRRLHDTGKSFRYCFFIFIPLFGLIFLFLFLIQDSFKETNIYGDSPKYQSYRADNLVNNHPAQQIIELNSLNQPMEQMNNQNLNNPQILSLNQSQLPVIIPNNSSNFQILNNQNQIDPPLVPNEDNQPGIYINS